MISKDTVKSLVDQWLEDKDYFLVDIEVSKDDKIVVEIDHADGVWIEDCADLSRYIEERLDRDEQDYELEPRGLSPSVGVQSSLCCGLAAKYMLRIQHFCKQH